MSFFPLCLLVFLFIYLFCSFIAPKKSVSESVRLLFFSIYMYFSREEMKFCILFPHCLYFVHILLLIAFSDAPKKSVSESVNLRQSFNILSVSLYFFLLGGCSFVALLLFFCLLFIYFSWPFPLMFPTSQSARQPASQSVSHPRPSFIIPLFVITNPIRNNCCSFNPLQSD